MTGGRPTGDADVPLSGLGSASDPVPLETVSVTPDADTASSTIPSSCTAVTAFNGLNAQTRLDGARAALNGLRETLTAPKFDSTDEAATWFADALQNISSACDIEFGANIAKVAGGYVIQNPAVGNTINPLTGMGYDVKISECPTCVAWVHTHPNDKTSSPQDKLYHNLYRENQKACVSMPNGRIDRYTRETNTVHVRPPR